MFKLTPILPFCACGCGEEVLKLQNRYINHHNTKHIHLGKSPSTETRRKISTALKGRVSPMRGRTFSEESKKKMSVAQTGKKLSDEIKRKISTTTLRQYRYEGRVGARFKHTKEARKKISDAM